MALEPTQTPSMQYVHCLVGRNAVSRSGGSHAGGSRKLSMWRCQIRNNGQLIRSGHCHCSKCRKAHGAAFRSRARVRVEDFKWVQGTELVKYFESSPGFHREFCSVCGSPIVNRPDRTPELGIALGGLDDDRVYARNATSSWRAKLPGLRSPTTYPSTRSFLLIPKSPKRKPPSSE